ncbi:MAG TPA: flagellar basal-body rod protein FlgF [Bacillales bacterium]|nr:flagellar basal-body rod protein FlgF [Bacillales bacterium]
MLRSMYAGISGMKNFQTKLDVIGNNIANVNTYGYKKSRVTFKDLVSQEIAGASSPTFERGGTNPKQVGLGSTIGSVDTVHTQGSLQTTGRPLDIAISGDGFFIVNEGAQNYYTRAGNFYIDQSGMLVNSEGMRVLGYGVDNNGRIAEGQLSVLNISDEIIQQPETDSVTVVGNLDANTFIDPTTAGSETTNTQSLDFTIFDANGVGHPATITFNNPAESTNPNDDGSYYVKTLDFTIDGGTGGTSPSGTITFNPDGTINNFTLPSDPATFNYGGNPVEINKTAIDFTALTVHDNAGTADVVGDVAELTGYQIGSSGEISAILSTGDVQLLGQIALAGFNNPGGLEKAGSNLYMVTNNSGEAEIAVPGDGVGSLQGGTLEMSNVDLATAFTEMIVAERGFQANTRIITTSDEILQELVNLKR